MTVGPFTEEIKVNRDVAPLNKVTTTLTCISHPCPSAQPGNGHFWTVHAPKGDRPQRSHLLCKWLCEPPSWGTVLPSTYLRSRGDADTRHWAQKTVRKVSLESDSIYSHPRKTGSCAGQPRPGSPKTNDDISGPENRAECNQQVPAQHTPSSRSSPGSPTPRSLRKFSSRGAGGSRRTPSSPSRRGWRLLIFRGHPPTWGPCVRPVPSSVQVPLRCGEPSLKSRAASRGLPPWAAFRQRRWRRPARVTPGPGPATAGAERDPPLRDQRAGASTYPHPRAETREPAHFRPEVTTYHRGGS